MNIQHFSLIDWYFDFEGLVWLGFESRLMQSSMILKSLCGWGNFWMSAPLTSASQAVGWQKCHHGQFWADPDLVQSGQACQHLSCIPSPLVIAAWSVSLLLFCFLLVCFFLRQSSCYSPCWPWTCQSSSYLSFHRHSPSYLAQDILICKDQCYE